MVHVIDSYYAENNNFGYSVIRKTGKTNKNGEEICKTLGYCGTLEEVLKLVQGFPKDYIIDRDYHWKPYPIAKQVARIGNSVVPIMAQKLVEANCPYLKVGERTPNLMIDDSGDQLRFA